MAGNTKAAKSSRVGLLDEIRGFAIICMVVYHTMFDLDHFFGVDVPIFFDDWFNIVRDVFAGSFIFISGTVCRYSSNNMKRGIQCFFIGMIMTFVMPFFTGSTIMFGILHFLGISMMIFGLCQKFFDSIPSVVGIIVSILLFIMTIGVRSGYIGLGGVFEWYLPEAAYNIGYLFPLGFPGPGFYSADYFPLLPWFFLFIAGSYFGVWAKDGLLPKFCYNTHIKWLASVGKYTIWIYILHQPIIYLILTLIFRNK